MRKFVFHLDGKRHAGYIEVTCYTYEGALYDLIALVKNPASWICNNPEGKPV